MLGCTGSGFRCSCRGVEAGDSTTVFLKVRAESEWSTEERGTETKGKKSPTKLGVEVTTTSVLEELERALRRS